MRIFTLSLLFIFTLFAGIAGTYPQTTHAGECVYDELAGAWHDSATFNECTPTDTVVGPQGTVQDRGAVVPPTQNQTGQNVRLINPLNTGECAAGENCLLNFLNKILDFVIRIGTVVVILMMVYVGYLFVAARGEPGKITEARNALLWTVVGALILLGSQAIAKGIEATVKALSG